MSCDYSCLNNENIIDNTNVVYKSWNNLFTTALLNLTLNCNLKCSYCFVNKENQTMKLQTIYDTIDMMAQNYEKKNEILGNVLKDNEEQCYLVFFGGEPMLEYNNIIKAVDYANNKYPKLFQYSITTNGTLLTKEKIDFFKKNNFNIVISIDGDKETQDYNRPFKNENGSSFDKIQPILSYALEKFPDMVFRSTISREKCNKMFENYLFAEKIGYKNYFCIPDYLNSDWTEEEINILSQEMRKIFNYRTNQFLNNILPMNFSTIDSSYKAILYHDIKVLQNNFDNKITWRNCGKGLYNVAINYNGDIYACQQEIYNQNEKNLFLIGNIYNGGINKEKHIKLIQDIENKNTIININPQKCNNCIAKNTCHLDGCISINYYTKNEKDKITMNDISCSWKKIFYENCIIQMRILTEKNNDLFFAYLLEYCKGYIDLLKERE